MDEKIDNTAILKSVETKISFKYLSIYLDVVMRALVLILPKMSRFVKTFENKGGDKEKNNELMYLFIYDYIILENNKIVWTNIEDLKSIKLVTLSVFYGRYMKPK